MKILKLTVHKKAFEVMVTGEKAAEYRNPSKWIMQRLVHNDGWPKPYYLIQFTNGYGKSRPSFTCKFEGWTEIEKDYPNYEYSNGLKVDVKKGTIVICLGEIVTKVNC